LRRFIGRHQSCFGCLGLLAAFVFCIGTVLLAIDRVCYTSLSRRLPLYPNAEVRLRQHNLFSEFGMGNTAVILFTQDEPDTVRQWYGRITSDYLRGTQDSGNPIDRLALRLAKGQWDVTRDESGAGSQVILFGTCVN
jgi:hypothetical protein